jgi:hypothetical protein
VHVRKVRHSLIRFSRNSQMLNSIIGWPRITHCTEIGQNTWKIWTEINLRPPRKAWLLLRQFSWHSEFLSGVTWRSCSEFIQIGRRCSWLGVKSHSHLLSKVWFAEHLFSRNWQLLNGITWRSIPDFTQIVQQTITDNIGNNKLIFALPKTWFSVSRFSWSSRSLSSVLRSSSPNFMKIRQTVQSLVLCHGRKDVVSTQGVLKERHVTWIHNFLLGVRCKRRRLIESIKRPLLTFCTCAKQNPITAYWIKNVPLSCYIGQGRFPLGTESNIYSIN